MRWVLAILLVLVLCQVCWAEVILSESFDGWDQAPGPGWNAVTAAGSKMSLVADGAGGKAVRTAAQRGKACYISRNLGSERRELYIRLRVKVESASNGATPDQFAPAVGALFLTSSLRGRQQNRTGMEMSIGTHDVILHTLTGPMGLHKTGLSWSRGETLEIGLGVKYGRDGFVKFYYAGAKIYEVFYDTSVVDRSAGAEFLRLGPQDNAACAVVFDDVRVATTEDEAGVLAKTWLTPSPLRINVDGGRVLRQTNFDCFGACAGLTDPVPYKNLKSATFPLGVTSVRWMLGQRLDWDEYENYAIIPPFFYKESESKNGRSFEEHLSYFGDNPRVVAIIDAYNTDPAGKKLDGPNGWVQYNKSRGHRDCIYEIGNEMDYPQRPQSSYMFTGSKWEQISDGVVRWVAPADRIPQSLMHSEEGYDYTFPLNSKGSAIYIGTRHRWRECRIEMAVAGRGNAKLGWAMWTDKGWETMHRGESAAIGQSRLSTLHGRTDDAHDVRNFTKSSGTAHWSDATYSPGGPFERWRPAGIGEISAGACPGEDKLYYVKVWLIEGAYDVEPCESAIGFTIDPTVYAALVKRLAGVVRKNGGAVYTSTVRMEGPGWTERLENVAPFVDGLAFHGYISQEPTWDAMKRQDSWYIPFQAMLYDLEYFRKMPGEVRARKALATKQLALTEWGCPDLGYIGGLGTAIGLCEILKGGWNSAQRYFWADASLKSENPHGLLRARSSGVATEWFERPSATVFKFIRRAAKSNIIPAECKYVESKAEKDYSGIYVCAFAGAKNTEKSLVLVNRTDVEMTDTPIRWKEAAGLRFRVSTLKSTAGIRGNNEGQEQQVTMDAKPAITFAGSGEARLTLSPYSLYILEVLE